MQTRIQSSSEKIATKISEFSTRDFGARFFTLFFRRKTGPKNLIQNLSPKFSRRNGPNMKVQDSAGQSLDSLQATSTKDQPLPARAKAVQHPTWADREAEPKADTQGVPEVELLSTPRLCLLDPGRSLIQSLTLREAFFLCHGRSQTSHTAQQKTDLDSLLNLGCVEGRHESATGPDSRPLGGGQIHGGHGIVPWVPATNATICLSACCMQCIRRETSQEDHKRHPQKKQAAFCASSIQKH